MSIGADRVTASRPDQVRAALSARHVPRHEVEKPDADIEHNGRLLVEAGEDAWKEVVLAYRRRGAVISEREARDVVEAYVSVYGPRDEPVEPPRPPPVPAAPAPREVGPRSRGLAATALILSCLAAACALPAWIETYVNEDLSFWPGWVEVLFVVSLPIGVAALVTGIIAADHFRWVPTGTPGKRLADASFVVAITGCVATAFVIMVGAMSQSM